MMVALQVLKFTVELDRSGFMPNFKVRFIVYVIMALKL